MAHRPSRVALCAARIVSYLVLPVMIAAQSGIVPAKRSFVPLWLSRGRGRRATLESSLRTVRTSCRP